MNKELLDHAIGICDTDQKLYRYLYEYGMSQGIVIGLFLGSIAVIVFGVVVLP